VLGGRIHAPVFSLIFSSAFSSVSVPACMHFLLLDEATYP
jgi:hypothetical protein